MNKNILKISICLVLVILASGFFFFLSEQSAHAAGHGMVQRGYLAARGLVLSAPDADGKRYPIWAEFNSSGLLVRIIGPASGDLAGAESMSRETFCSLFQQNEACTAPQTARAVLANSKTRDIYAVSAWNIGFLTAYYTPKGGDDKSGVDGTYGLKPGDTLWGPVKGAKVEYSGWKTASDETGLFSLKVNMPISCLPYTEDGNVLVTLRFRNFDPEDPDHSGFYYVAWPCVYNGGGDIYACPKLISFEYLTPGSITYDYPPGLQNAINENRGSSWNAVNIPIDVAMLTGHAVLQNDQRQVTEHNLIGIDADVKGVIPVSDKTAYYIDPEALPTTDADNCDHGLLDTITKADLEKTDIYVFRVSNDQMIASQEGLGKNVTNWYYGGGVGSTSEARVHYKMMMRGPLSFNYRGRAAQVEKWQASVHMDQELRGLTSDHLKVGETVKVILVNRATGYIGSNTAQVGYGGGSTTLINFSPAEIILRPPNLTLTAERRYKVDMGLTKGDEYEHIIGFEGSGLTSDEYIMITSNWVDWDGKPLPANLPGYTGRLAKVVDVNTLGQPLIANFEITPGLHKILVQLPQKELDKAHYYVHVNGVKISGNPDFSVGGDEAGILQYRPKKYVPVKVPIFDESATENARKIKPSADPIYNYVYRPETQFTLFDLNIREIGQESVSGTTDSKCTLIERPEYQFQIPWLEYTLQQDKFPELYRFGTTRELDYVLVNDKEKALIFKKGDLSVIENELLKFKNPGHIIEDLDWEKIENLDAMDLLGIRLLQTSDPENVLWRYEFPFIHSIVLAGHPDGRILPGESATAIAHTYPEKREVTWSITQRDLYKEDVFVEVDEDSGRITVDEESPMGFFVLRATDKENPTIYREEVIFVLCKECDQCGENGKGLPDVGCVDMRFSVGHDTHGGSAGTIMLFSDKITPELSTPAKILFTSLSWDQLDDENGIKRVTAPDGSLRQILAPESFVDIRVPETGSGYDIYFYKREAAGEKNDDGYYEVANSAAVDAVWRVSGSGNSLTIADILHQKETYVYTQPDENTIALSINGAKIITRTVTPSGEDHILTETIADASGSVGQTTAKTLRKFPRGTVAVSSTNDPGGAALTTAYTYYENSPDTGAYGRIKSEINPDGSWARFYYDSDGRRIKTVRSWLDVLPDAPENQARVITYEYTPLSGDPNLPENRRRPRTIAEFIEGKPVSKTYHAYTSDGFGNRIEITEECPTVVSSYISSANLRTERIYFKDDLKSPGSGKLQSITYPDSRKDTYIYETGSYSIGTPGAFSPGNGTDVRETVIHGALANPAGIAFKTTNEIRISDAFGRQLMQSSEVCTGSGYTQIQWTVNTLDDKGHVIKTETSAGAVTQSAWGCCNMQSFVDESGIPTDFTYDDLNRLVSQTRPGPSGDMVTSYTYDAAGRRLTQTVSAGALAQTTASEYDTAGRLVQTMSADGLLTQYDYTNAGRTTTTTRPGGAAEITTRYLDGQVKSVTGQGVVARYYEYGVNADGTRWAKVCTGEEGSAVWEKTTTDHLGRVVKAEKPGFGGTITTAANTYNNRGQLIRTQTTGQADQLFIYDALGNQIKSGLDVDGSGNLESASTDRITETATAYAQFNGDWWQQSSQQVYADESGAATSTGIQRNRITGLGAGGLVSETVAIDIFGNQTVATTAINRASHTETRTIDYPDSDIDAQSSSINGFMVNATGKTGVTTTYQYDALGRQIHVIDPRTGTSITHYDAHGRVDYVQDAAGSRTTFAYDPDTGRKIAETNALGNTTRYAYNAQGQVTHTWGNAAYPVSYEYNEFGQMTTMLTYRTGSNWDGDTFPDAEPGDATTWTYDTAQSGEGATGLLIAKTDAAGNATTYTYDPAGRLSTRTWARTENSNPVTTTYTYNPATGDLTGIDYSDATPDVAFTYDRLGRQTGVNDATGHRTFAYNDHLQLESEQMTGIINRTTTRNYETSGVEGRNSGFTVGGYNVSYGYDATGRMNAVNWNAGAKTGSADYAYAPNSDLLASVSVNGNLNTTYTYDPHRNVKTQVQNAYSAQVISQYDYAYDAFGRRTSVVNTGTAFTANAHNAYDYNDRNELTESARYLGNNQMDTTQPVQPEYRAYQYDPIGNRKNITEASDTGNYTANSLNQYLSQTTPGDGTRSFDYDEDGNLISLVENGSEKVYTWNAENQLTSVAPRTPTSGDKKVEFIYDYMGRRVKKSVYSYTAGAWQADKEKFFVYDGWNLAEEVTEIGATQTSRYFICGLDLSQSLQGAGGIGGLQATVDGSASYLYCYDANGNVGQLVNAANGAIAAKYEYDPYGNPIHAEGAYAVDNSFRFSTKYDDDETELLYYGYRYYSTAFGRWLSNDPIGENGGISLYSFVQNNVINQFDILGLWGIWAWMDATHGDITEEAFNQAKESLGAEFSHIMDQIKWAIIGGNLFQDILHSGDHRRHYSTTEYVNPSLGEREFVAGLYESYLDEENKIFTDLIYLDNPQPDKPEKDDCRFALSSLGRLSHSWQDYYGHGVNHDGGWDVGTMDLGFPKSMILLPCTYGYWPWRKDTEHPPGMNGEPVTKDSLESFNFGGRVQASIRFTEGQFKWFYFSKWAEKCKCFAENLFDEDYNDN